MTADIDITAIIHRFQGGDKTAGDALFTVCAARLQAISRSLMRQEKTDGFHPSDLLQEAFAQKLSRGRVREPVADREHFFSLITRGMRQVLKDRARLRSAQKRDASLVANVLTGHDRDDRLVDVRMALDKLARLDPDGRELVRLRYESGMTWDETSRITGRPVGELRLECDYVLAWLRAKLI